MGDNRVRGKTMASSDHEGQMARNHVDNTNGSIDLIESSLHESEIDISAIQSSQPDFDAQNSESRVSGDQKHDLTLVSDSNPEFTNDSFSMTSTQNQSNSFILTNTHNQSDITGSEIDVNGGMTNGSTSVNNDTESSGNDTKSPVSDDTMARINQHPSNACPRCDNPDDDYMIQCAGCRSWTHYPCSELPRYQLYAYTTTTRKFECQDCIAVPSDFAPDIDNAICSVATGPCINPEKCDLDGVKALLTSSFRLLESNIISALNESHADRAELRIELLQKDLAMEKRTKGQLECDLALSRKDSKNLSLNCTVCVRN